VYNLGYMRKRLLLVLGLLLVVVLLLTSVRAFLGHQHIAGADKIGQQFIAAVADGDASKSRQLFTAAAQVDNPVNGSWGQFVERLNIIFNGQRPRLMSSQPDGQQLILTYSIDGNDNQNYHMILTMTQENGWKVDSFTSGENNP